MREKFLDFLDRRGRWDVRVWERQDGHVWEGMLLRDGAAKYPIIDGIPRLLSGQWLDKTLREHPEFRSRHLVDLRPLLELSRTSTNGDAHEQIKLETADSFGEEWHRFDRMLDAYERNHRMYFAPYRSEFFQGKIGLDVGCGMGRHVYWGSKHGAEIVGVDLSRAVEVAFSKLKDTPNVHLAQADAYNLPFSPESFDFVESIGVVHHLPDPPGALELLTQLVKPAGCLYVYLYTKTGRQPKTWSGKLKFAMKERVYRPIGRALPRDLMSLYTLAYAATGRVFLNLPWKVVRRVPQMERYFRWMPLRQYADYPLYVLHSDIYDWVAAPLRAHYDRTELDTLFAPLGFSRVEVFDEPEWRVFAWK